MWFSSRRVSTNDPLVERFTETASNIDILFAGVVIVWARIASPHFVLFRGQAWFSSYIFAHAGGYASVSRVERRAMMFVINAFDTCARFQPSFKCRDASPCALLASNALEPATPSHLSTVIDDTDRRSSHWMPLSPRRLNKRPRPFSPQSPQATAARPQLCLATTCHSAGSDDAMGSVATVANRAERDRHLWVQFGPRLGR
jgi:hypothetical protein